MLRVRQIGADVDRAFDTASNRTVIGVKTVDSLCGFFVLVSDAGQRVGDVNAFYHEHLAVKLDLTSRVRDESSTGCVNTARFQRAPEGSRKSTGRGGNHVVDRRCILRVQVGIDVVMLSNGAMHAKRNRLRKRRNPGSPDGSPVAFDTDVRLVGKVVVWHGKTP